jgi:hypothetical protein
MKTIIPLLLLVFLATSFSKPKFLGRYEGKLESYSLLIDGNQVTVEEAKISLDIFESKIKITVQDKNEVMDEYYSYALLSTDKSGTILLLSKENSSATGELTISKKGNKSVLKSSLYGSSVDLVKVKK